MPSRATLFLFVLVSAVLATPTSAEEPAHEMTTYQIALLHQVPGARPMGEREIQGLQEEHLAAMRRLVEEGKVLAQGPIEGGGELERVVVLAVATPEEAAAILAEDAWVKAGRQKPEIHPWWAAKGILRKPSNLLHLEPCTLGLLRRPPDAPAYPEEKLKEIQEGHRANIRAMAASGDLVIAGPLGDDGLLRGVFVFRTTDLVRLSGLVARDPAVKAGRLGAELYPWRIPAGTLPER